MSQADNASPSQAERNWQIVRERLCARINRHTLTLARLTNDPVAPTPAPDDPASIDDAEVLLARLEHAEQLLDRAFAKRALRVAETSRQPERRDPDMQAFQTR